MKKSELLASHAAQAKALLAGDLDGFVATLGKPLGLVGGIKWDMHKRDRSLARGAWNNAAEELLSLFGGNLGAMCRCPSQMGLIPTIDERDGPPADWLPTPEELDQFSAAQVDALTARGLLEDDMGEGG